MPVQPSSPIEVVQPIRRSIIVLGVRMFILLFIADSIYAGLLLFLVIGVVPTRWTTEYTVVLWFVHTVKNVLLTYSLLHLVVSWISTMYYVTAGHLIRQRGVLHTEDTIYQLTDIESVVMDQSWLGKLLNFGDVTITFFVARIPEKVTLYSIENPKRYEELFSKYV